MCLAVAGTTVVASGILGSYTTKIEISDLKVDFNTNMPNEVNMNCSDIRTFTWSLTNPTNSDLNFTTYISINAATKDVKLKFNNTVDQTSNTSETGELFYVDNLIPSKSTESGFVVIQLAAGCINGTRELTHTVLPGTFEYTI